MKIEIDKELIKQLNGIREKPRSFVFMPGIEHSVLLIDTKPISESTINAAKKKSIGPNENSYVLKGICFAEVDQTGQRTIVFEVKRLDSSYERLIRKAIKENAGLNLQIEMRQHGKSLEKNQDLQAEPDQSPSLSRTPRHSTQEQKDTATKALYKKMLNLIGTRINDLERHEPGAGTALRARIMPLLTQAEGLAGNDLPEDRRDYKGALKVLVKAKDLVLARAKKAPSIHGGKGNDLVDEEYFILFKEVKGLVARLHAQGEYAAIVEADLRLKEASQLANLMKFEEATRILANMPVHLKLVLGQITKIATAILHARELTEPAFPGRDLEAFESDIPNALNLPLEQVGVGLVSIEDRLQDKLVERDRVIEANRSLQMLLVQAGQKLGGHATQEWEVAHDRAWDQVERTSFNSAYEALTNIETEVRKALRQSETTPQSEILKGETEEARRLKFQLNLDNLGKALGQIAKSEVELIKQCNERLRKIALAGKVSLDKAELALDALNDVVRKALAKHREQRGRLETTPMAPQRRPQMGFRTTEGWSRDIQQRNILGKVKPGKEIDRGGFGMVQILESIEPNEPGIPPLIIKVSLDPTGDTSDLEQEAELYRKVGDHPNLPKCLGMQTVNGKRGLVVERVQGRTMENFSKELNDRFAKGEITFNDYNTTIQYTLSKTLEALNHLHDKGLTHNDIKPANVMIDEVTGEVKVIDLGSVIEQHNPNPSDNALYKAPEGANKGDSGNQKTDAFSAGGVAFEALHGQGFHFRNPTGMLNSFMAKVQEVMVQYSKLETEQGVYHDSDDKHPTKVRVNEKGEENKSGKFLKDDSMFKSARTQLTDFMNLLMHPDPNKRLSPKQALEHPFLRDCVKSEEEIKEFLTQSNTAPTRLHKSAKEVRAYAMENLDSKLRNIKQYGDEARALDVGALEPKELTANRQLLTTRYQEISNILNRFNVSVKMLQGVVDTTGNKNHEQFFKDNQLLETVRHGAADALDLQLDMEQILEAIDVRMEQSLPDLTEAVKDGSYMPVEQVTGRLNEIKNRWATAKRDTTYVLTTELPTVPGIYNRVSLLKNRLQQNEKVLAGFQSEHALIEQLARSLETTPEGREAGRRLERFGPAMEEAIENLEEQIRSVTRGLEEIYNTLTAQATQVDALLADTADVVQKIDHLVEAVKTSQRELSGLGSLIRQMPRVSSEEQAKFDKAKVAFEKEVLRQRGANQKEKADIAVLAQALVRRFNEKQLELGSSPAPQDLRNLTTSLKEGRALLKSKLEEIPQA